MLQNGPGSVKVSWKHPSLGELEPPPPEESLVTGYIIYYLQDGEKKSLKVDNAKLTNATITKLRVGSTCSIEMAAVCSTVCSAVTTAPSCTILEGTFTFQSIGGGDGHTNALGICYNIRGVCKLHAHKQGGSYAPLY